MNTEAEIAELMADIESLNGFHKIDELIAEIEKFEVKIKKIKADIQKLKEQKAEAEISELEVRIKNLTAEITKIEAEISSSTLTFLAAITNDSLRREQTINKLIKHLNDEKKDWNFLAQFATYIYTVNKKIFDQPKKSSDFNQYIKPIAFWQHVLEQVTLKFEPKNSVISNENFLAILQNIHQQDKITKLLKAYFKYLQAKKMTLTSREITKLLDSVLDLSFLNNKKGSEIFIKNLKVSILLFHSFLNAYQSACGTYPSFRTIEESSQYRNAKNSYMRLSKKELELYQDFKYPLENPSAALFRQEFLKLDIVASLNYLFDWMNTNLMFDPCNNERLFRAFVKPLKEADSKHQWLTTEALLTYIQTHDNRRVAIQQIVKLLVSWGYRDTGTDTRFTASHRVSETVITITQALLKNKVIFTAKEFFNLLQCTEFHPNTYSGWSRWYRDANTNGYKGYPSTEFPKTEYHTQLLNLFFTELTKDNISEVFPDREKEVEEVLSLLGAYIFMLNDTMGFEKLETIFDKYYLPSIENYLKIRLDDLMPLEVFRLMDLLIKISIIQDEKFIIKFKDKDLQEKIQHKIHENLPQEPKQDSNFLLNSISIIGYLLENQSLLDIPFSINVSEYLKAIFSLVNQSDVQISVSQVIEILNFKINDSKRQTTFISQWFQNNNLNFTLDQLTNILNSNFPTIFKDTCISFCLDKNQYKLNDLLSISSKFHNISDFENILVLYLQKYPDQIDVFLANIHQNKNCIIKNEISKDFPFDLMQISKILFKIYELHTDKLSELIHLFQELTPSEYIRQAILLKLIINDNNKNLFINLLPNITEDDLVYQFLNIKTNYFTPLEILKLLENRSTGFLKKINHILKNYTLNSEILTDEGLKWLANNFQKLNSSTLRLDSFLMFVQLKNISMSLFSYYIDPNIRKELTQEYLNNPSLLLTQEEKQLIDQIFNQPEGYLEVKVLIAYLQRYFFSSVDTPPSLDFTALDKLFIVILNHIKNNDLKNAKQQYQELLKNLDFNLKPEDIQKELDKIDFNKLHSILQYQNNYNLFLDLLATPKGLTSCLSVFSTTPDGCTKNATSQLQASWFASKDLDTFTQFIYEIFYQWASKILSKYPDALGVNKSLFEVEKIKNAFFHYETFLLTYQNKILHNAPELQNFLTQLNLNNDPNLSQDEQENRLAKIKQAFSSITMDEYFLNPNLKKQLACLKYLTAKTLNLPISTEEKELGEKVLQEFKIALKEICAEQKIPTEPEQPVKRVAAIITTTNQQQLKQQETKILNTVST